MLLVGFSIPIGRYDDLMSFISILLALLLEQARPLARKCVAQQCAKLGAVDYPQPGYGQTPPWLVGMVGGGCGTGIPSLCGALAAGLDIGLDCCGRLECGDFVRYAGLSPVQPPFHWYSGCLACG